MCPYIFRWNRWWFTSSRHELTNLIPAKFVSEIRVFNICDIYISVSGKSTLLLYVIYMQMNDFEVPWFLYMNYGYLRKWYDLSPMSILTLWIIDIELHMMKHVRPLISKWYVINAWKLYISHMILKEKWLMACYPNTCKIAW